MRAESNSRQIRWALLASGSWRKRRSLSRSKGSLISLRPRSNWRKLRKPKNSESPGGQAIRAAGELFEAQALFDGEECPVHLRVAECGSKLYLDLCDRAWRAVEIDHDGWRVVDRPPAKFRRTRGSQPLPEPERGGSLEELRPFFNVDHQGWTLVKAFLVAALVQASPYLFWSPRASRARASRPRAA